MAHGQAPPIRERSVTLEVTATVTVPSPGKPRRLGDVVDPSGLSAEVADLLVEPLYGDTSKLDRLAKIAYERDRTYKAPTWSRRLLVEPSALAARAAEELAGASDVVGAEIAPHPAPSPGFVVPAASVDPYLDWLRKAPAGVGAEPLWLGSATPPAGKGARVHLVERGADLAHPEIDPARITLSASSAAVNGTCSAAEKGHGQRSLGVLVAQAGPASPSGPGAVPAGVAPEVDAVQVHCVGPAVGGDSTGSLTRALVDAVVASTPGDVLVVEMQTWSQLTLLPIEVHRIWWDLIRLATSIGVTVVEAAGNGGYDLDQGLGDAVDINTEDSGAILVASGTRVKGTWQAARTSNRGKRIDCFAPDAVTSIATEIGGAPAPVVYTSTSAATAVLGGVAAVVQGAWASPLSPADLRAKLKAHGTPGTQIGTMPDLERLLKKKAPKLIVRDHLRQGLGDGPRHRSPDIVVSEAGMPAPSAPDEAPTPPLQAGRGHQVHVFVKNDGEGPSKGGRVEVWVARPATMLPPSAWKLVGGGELPELPPGAGPVASSAVELPAKALGGAGHFAFIARATEAGTEPIPLTLTAAQFADLVQQDDALAMRSVHRVELDARAEATALAFDMRGADVGDATFTLEIQATLPAGASLVLDHGGRLGQLGCLAGLFARAATTSDLGARGGVQGPVVVPARATWPMTLRVGLPGASKGGEVIARQLLDGREVGRVTWALTRSG